MPTYAERLNHSVRCKQTAALVGLDPRWEQLPGPLRTRAQALGGSPGEVQARAYEEFCLRIIDVVAGLVPAVKPQAAFFEECGPWGMTALRNVICAAREAGLIVICDAKRGDMARIMVANGPFVQRTRFTPANTRWRSPANSL